MARKQTKTAQKGEAEALSSVIEDFGSSWNYAKSNYHQRWEDSWKLYNNTRVKVGYQGITKAFVPMVFSTVETMVSALFGSKPQFDFIPPFEKQDQDTKILNSLLDYYWDKDQWSIKIINWGRSMISLGTGVVFIYWDMDHPCMVNVPLRDFFIDPTASGLDNARYMGRRYLTTLDELKSFEVVDPETGEMMPRFKNLNKVAAGYSSDDQTDKEVKDMFYGSTVDDAHKVQVEVIEHWTKDRVISVANRSVVIEDTVNPHKSKAQETDEYAEGLIPFAVQRNYLDESLFYAKGDIEVIADQQELLNDLTAQNIDSITFTLNQMYTLDPKYAHLLNEVENIPGAIYMAEKDALSPIIQRPIPPEAFNERLNIKNEIRETTASNEIVKGVGQEQTTTATEVNAQIAGAGQRLGLKITQIENEGFHRLARIVFEMIKLYVNEPTMVRVVGKDGISWEEFDPNAFRDGTYEPRAMLQSTINSQKEVETQTAKEMLAAFLNDPDVNQRELKKMVLIKAFELDPDEVESLTNPEDPMMDPAMAGLMGDPSMMLGGEMAEPVPDEADMMADEIVNEELVASPPGALV